MVDYNAELFVHPQEVWDDKKCQKEARAAPYGGPKGIISTSSSARPRFGIVRYNGGCVRNNQWYQGKQKPFPAIPDDWEIVPLPTWGMKIQKKIVP